MNIKIQSSIVLPFKTRFHETAVRIPAVFWYYKSSVWKDLSAMHDKISDTDGDTKVHVEETVDEDRFDLAGNERLVLRQNVSGNPRLELINAIDNTFIGLDAGFSNTIGSSNTASGASALRSNTTGFSNTASGRDALFSNTTGSSNTANGYRALFSNTTGSDNTANGMNALRSNTTGFNNTANGRDALFSNTTGSFNTANGRDALFSNTIGSQNVAFGIESLRSNVAQAAQDVDLILVE